MSDIVKKLRSRTVAHWVHGTCETLRSNGFKPDPDCAAAADEIERPRAKLGERIIPLIEAAVAAERERWVRYATDALEILEALPPSSNSGFACNGLREALGPNVGAKAPRGRTHSCDDPLCAVCGHQTDMID